MLEVKDKVDRKPERIAPTYVCPLTPLLVNHRQLGAMLGISPRHLRAMRSSGKLPDPIRFGKLKLWRVTDITQWVADLS